MNKKILLKQWQEKRYLFTYKEYNIYSLKDFVLWTTGLEVFDCVIAYIQTLPDDL